MSAGRYDMTNVEQGATFARTVAYKDSLGMPIDLTGVSVRMQVRTNFGAASELVLELTTENGLAAVPLPEDGLINLLAPAALMEGIEAGKYKYDLELVWSTAVLRLLEGCFKIKPEVTV